MSKNQANNVIEILLTGARGSIGTYVKDALSSKRYHITTLDTIKVNESLTLEDDINFKKFDYVLHFGASSDRNNQDLNKIYNNNIIFTERLFKKLSNNKKVKVIFLSAMSIISQPNKSLISEKTIQSANDFYSLSKLIGEKILFNYLELNRVLIIRIPSVYGTFRADKDGLLSRWKSLLLKNKEINIKGGDRKINSAILIKSLVNFIDHILFQQNIKFGSILFLSSYDYMTLLEIALKMKKKLSSKSKIISSNDSNVFDYLIDIDLSIKYGYKPDKMIKIINTVCLKNKLIK